LLLISHTKLGLLRSVQQVASSFRSIGLDLAVDKYESLIFNSDFSPDNLGCSSFCIPCVASICWLSLTICSTSNSIRHQTHVDIKTKLKIGYSKIVMNHGRSNRRVFAKLFSSCCDHPILFYTGLHAMLNRDDFRRI